MIFSCYFTVPSYQWQCSHLVIVDVFPYTFAYGDLLDTSSNNSRGTLMLNDLILVLTCVDVLHTCLPIARHRIQQ